MSNNIVQLTDYNDNNIYPIAGAAAQGSITKSMLEEGVFEGPELSEPSTVAYVATDNIQDGAVTSDKIDWTTIDIVRPLSVTAQSNFTIYENGSGFIEFGGKNIVLINLEITVGSSSVSGETILAQFGNDLPIGSAGPQMSAIATSGSSIFPCTSWIRATTKALVVTPSSTVQANGKFRITGAYIA